MHSRHPPGSFFRSALAALLLLAMLAGQWTGLEHRVRHAGLNPALGHLVAGTINAANAASDNGDEGYAHSCQLFDAATLAAVIHTDFFSAACDRAAQDWRPSWSPRTWQAVFSAHFSSRAPPFD